jgi:hypothetical protein
MSSASRVRFLLLVLLMEAALVWTIRVTAPAGVAGGALSRKRVEAPQAPPPPPKPRYETLKRLSFEGADPLRGWEEKVFKGKSAYKVLVESGRRFLSSVSENASSGLFMKMDVKMQPGLCLAWNWRVTEFPVKKDPERLSARSQDDFAARVYVVFPGSNFFNTNVIEYIWDESLPPGTVASSPFSSRVKLFVIRSGRPSTADGWHAEQRNVYEDYLKLFGKKPDRRIGALALMSDSDNTGTRTKADFGDLELRVFPAPGGDPAENATQRKEREE